jgi:hypothetical protein
MRKALELTTVLTLLLAAGISSAREYRVDWSVLASGGGSTGSGAGTAYRAQATAVQTAAGTLTGLQFLAVVGFWQGDFHTGISERPHNELGESEPQLKFRGPHPNPLRTRTSISYALPSTRRVTMRIYDLTGRTLAELVNSDQSAGKYELVWDGADRAGRRVANGVYFYDFRAGGDRRSGKLLVAW